MNILNFYKYNKRNLTYLFKLNSLLLSNVIINKIQSNSQCEELNKNLNFNLLDLINEGSYGKVYKSDDEKLAIKKILSNIHDNNLIKNEINILDLINKKGGHPNIIKYNNYYIYDDNYYIITEYIKGNTLYDEILNKKFNTNEIINLIKQLSLALLFLHNNNIIHCDIKPENIIIKKNLELKLIDFGSANLNNNKVSHMNYTIAFVSPEVLIEKNITYGLDMWALGCIFYILISGRHPFDPFGCLNKDQIINNILNKQVSFIYPEFQNISKDIKILISKLLEKDHTKRITIEEFNTLISKISIEKNNGTSGI